MAAAGYRFNLVDARKASGIDLKGCGTVVTVDGHDYKITKGATYEGSCKIGDLLDSHGDKPISASCKQPQGTSLKQAAIEACETLAKLFDKSASADNPTRRGERQEECSSRTRPRCDTRCGRYDRPRNLFAL